MQTIVLTQQVHNHLFNRCGTGIKSIAAFC